MARIYEPHPYSILFCRVCQTEEVHKRGEDQKVKCLKCGVGVLT